MRMNKGCCGQRSLDFNFEAMVDVNGSRNCWDGDLHKEHSVLKVSILAHVLALSVVTMSLVVPRE